MKNGKADPLTPIRLATKEAIDSFEVDGKNLFELLEALDFCDESEEDVFKKQKEILVAVQNKADGYKYICDRYKREEDRLEQIIKEFQKRKSAVAAGQRRIKSIAKWVIESELQKDPDRNFVNGKLFRVQRVKTKSVVEIKQEPDSMLRVRYPKLVRSKYEWRKDLLISEYQNDPELAKFCDIKENHTIRFFTKKDV